jgi:hypothetical protein
MVKIKVKRGEEANLPTFDEGEPGFTTDTKRVFFGSNEGNIELAKKESVDSIEIELTGKASVKKVNGFINIAEYDAVGDGVTSDQTAIVAAIADAKTKGMGLYWGAGTYLSIDNIPDFHNVKHLGEGVIKRGSDLYAITPTLSDTNILYTGFGGLSTNDGLSSSQPRKLSNVVDVLKNLGGKASNGQWRIQFVAGTITDTGLVFNDLPYFSQPLQIWGVWDGTNRLAVWDGVSSSAVYAIRADAKNEALNIEFKDMKFINWSADPSNAGAIVCWYGVNVLTENCEVKDSTVGFWMRGGYSRHYGDVLDNCVWGIGMQYNHSGQIGNSAQRVTIKNCDKGLMLGRQSVTHLDYTDLSGNIMDVNAHQKSRFASIGTTFTQWTNFSIWLQGDSIFEDGGSNTWDANSITDATPIFRFDNGSSVPDYYAGPLPYRGEHFVPAAGYTLTGTTTETLLTAQTGFGTPLRMPKNMLYNNGTLQIKIVGRMDMAGTGTKVIRLTGPSSSVSYELGKITIPAGGGLGELVCEVTFKPNGSAYLKMRYESNNTALNTVAFTTISSTVITVLRDKTQDISNWRIYASLTTAADSLSIYSLTTTITG